MMKPLKPDMPIRPAALDVGSLSKSFRGKLALDQVSFVVPEGSLTVLLGPAGAGKTTILRTIAGLDRPDTGRVVMGETDVTMREPKDRDIAMIFDNLALYPNKTGFENIAHSLQVRGGLTKAEIVERVQEMGTKLRIPHVLNRLPKTMSGGERQRVALARALVRKPRLFLLDEPLSSLDTMLRIELRAELKRLQRELGATFLLATPDFAEAMAVGDTVIMLREGRVVQVASAQTLYDQPVDWDTARFVGTPEINLLSAEYDGSGENCFRCAGVAFDELFSVKRVLPKDERRFVVGIRPEGLRLADPNAGEIQGRVTDIEPLGLKSVLTVNNGIADLRLVIEANVAGRMTVGELVGLNVVRDGLLAFDRMTGARIG